MRTAQKNILVVEDNPEDITAIERTLRKASASSYRVLAVPSAQEALDLLGQQQVECILLDYMMPGLDGLEFLCSLPKEADITAIPVIMLTGLGNEEVAVSAMKAGAWDYLVKYTDGRHLKMLPLLVDRAIREHLTLLARHQAEESLRNERNFISAVLDTQGALVAVLDSEGRIVRFNHTCEKTTGYSHEEAMGRHVWDFLLPQGEVESVKAVFARLQAGDFPNRHENHWLTKNGELRLVNWSNTALTDSTGRVSHVIATGIDITDQRNTEARLRLAASVVDNIIEGMFVTEANGAIVSVNPAFSTITGFSEKEVLGQNPRIIKSFRHDPAFYREMWEAVRERGYWQGEIWNRRKNGEAFLSRQTITAIYDKNGKPSNFVSVFSDATEIKQQEERIHYQAYHDALTGLPNRMLFHDRLDRLLAQAQRLAQMAAVLFLDLDHFKEINDTLGHDVGDLLLQEVAKRLLDCVRDSDTVSRLGGDEFTLVLSDIKRAADAASVSEKIMLGLERPFYLAGKELYISASIGISLYPSDGRNVQELMKHADAAMYLAKNLGRQGYQFYTEEMTVKASKLLSIETGLRRALDKKQFFLSYQPQFDIHSRKLACVEALLRWDHPDLGTQLPPNFLMAAENSGLIVPIGEWVVRTACAQVRAWQKEGLFAVVSVNISAAQLHHPGLTQMITDVLAAESLEPVYLELEVSEGTIMARPEEAMSILQALKKIGVRLSIDNFGSAYCSLRHLKQLPVDKLKIDRSFIQNLPGNAADAAMAASVITMSHNLHLQVVAEGVEMPEQVAFLQDHGCDQFQGYFCGNPMSEEGVREVLQACE
ncbi:MAG: EAL domain-containing protein [Sulfuricella denitrificans]|nr:EAL domain-containing protein [Sulfuricella denitrificans]